MEDYSLLEKMHPLLQKVIMRIVKSGLGNVIMTEDGHLFVETCEAIETIRGALDMKKEGKKYGVRVVVRQAKKRSKRSKYAGLPMIQLYVLPIVEKTAATMTDAEKQNIELNKLTLTKLHAAERDAKKMAYYQQLYAEQDSAEGGEKYTTFYRFLYAMCRKQVEKELAAKAAEQKGTMNVAEERDFVCRCIPLYGAQGIELAKKKRRDRKHDQPCMADGQTGLQWRTTCRYLPRAA